MLTLSPSPLIRSPIKSSMLSCRSSSARPSASLIQVLRNDSHRMLPIRATHHLPLAFIASFLINPEVAAVLEPLKCGRSTSSMNSSNISRRSGLIRVGSTAKSSKMEAMRFASPSRSPSRSSCPAQSKNPGNPGATSSLEYSRASTNAA